MKIVVGDGCRIQFWHDRWCMDLQLKEEFPRGDKEAASDDKGCLCDVVKWTASSSGVFTVASVRAWLQKNSGPSLLVPKMLWNNLAPPKAQFLSWLAWRGRVKSSVVLQRLGVLDNSVSVVCPFCSAAEESMDHLFVQCNEIWKEISKENLVMVPVAMLWSTWRLRNEVVFKGHLPDMKELGELVKVRVGLWVSLPNVHYSVHQIVENLSEVRQCI
ncbi:hypothetical protein ACSBR1_018904 [Camellia fascicularis]